MRQDQNRRDFIKLASTVSAGVVLTGTAATITKAQESDIAGPPPQTVEDQFDTWVELNIDNLKNVFKLIVLNVNTLIICKIYNIYVRFSTKFNSLTISQLHLHLHLQYLHLYYIFYIYIYNIYICTCDIYIYILSLYIYYICIYNYSFTFIFTLFTFIFILTFTFT